MTDSDFTFPLHRDRLYEQVADQIQEMIVIESLRPGDRLPSERLLAERLGVSRTVIREAVRVLSERCLVAVKPGSGTYVQELSPSAAGASIGLYLRTRQSSNQYQDLNEVRRTLEVEIAGLAADRATDEDIGALDTAIEGLTKFAEDEEHFTRYDLDFHSALATATHNELYSVLMAPITELLLEFRLTAYRVDKQGAIEGALTFHQEILDRIKAGDPKGARQAMRLHLDQAERLMEAAYASH